MTIGVDENPTIKIFILQFHTLLTNSQLIFLPFGQKDWVVKKYAVNVRTTLHGMAQYDYFFIIWTDDFHMFVIVTLYIICGKKISQFG